MALTLKEIKTIKYAIVNNKQIIMRYFPNTNPTGRITTQRIIIPIRLFSRIGKNYLLAYFLSGGSLSNDGEGYRLYIQENLRDVKLYDVNNPVKLNKFKHPSESQVFKMILKNKIEI